MASEHGEPRFFLRRDDVENDAGLLAHPLDEFLAVGRAPARFGRHRTGEMDVPAPELVGADLERADRAIHRRVAQPSALRQPFAEPDDTAEGVDHDEVDAGRPGNQQPAVVRAEIDRGISLALVEVRGSAPLQRAGSFARFGDALLDLLPGHRRRPLRR